jgi:cytochrome c-type biogenesis protein CcmE
VKPKHQRLVFVGVSVLFLCVSVLLSMRAFRDNLVFFYSPSDISRKTIDPARLIRIGGLVENGSLVRGEHNRIDFNVTDNAAHLAVSYSGMLPSLFREGQGVVAEGYLKDAQHFEASTILAKHDENYMPKEVVDSLKRAGQWKGSK